MNNTIENDESIRQPDKIYTESLVGNSQDFIANINHETYNEDEKLNEALLDSVNDYDEKYFEEQLMKIYEEDHEQMHKEIEHQLLEEVEQQILEESLLYFNNEIKIQKEKVEEEERILAESLLHFNNEIKIKKDARKKSLESLYINIIKIKSMIHSNGFILLDQIINDYIECNIDNYVVNEDQYQQIFKELARIRVKDSEIDIIKNIILKI